MRLCVFGASGPVGRAVVDRALAADHHVTAVTRRPDDYGSVARRLRVVGGDVMDPAAVAAAIDGADAVISPVRPPCTAADGSDPRPAAGLDRLDRPGSTGRGGLDKLDRPGG